MRVLTVLLGLIAGTTALTGATLEKLSLDEMIEKSTAIVRGRVVSARTLSRGPVLYTLSKVQVLERLKGADGSTVEVALPGGSQRGVRQSFSGTPELSGEREYILFLWTGKSGINHVIGLSQGLFVIAAGVNGEAVVHRAASGEVMIDPKSGRRVEDAAISMALSELRDRVDRALEGGSR
jgi:hypothetical protein